jgi:Ca-activated chloride channel family protein
MRVRAWPFIALTVAAVVCPLAAARQAFYASADVVHVPVVVMSRSNALVHGLTSADFQVLEDGKPQQISFFSEGGAGETLPMHLGLLLDTSESMERDLPDAAGAAVKFVDSLDEAVDVTLVDFDTTIRVGKFSPQSYPMLFERIRARKASGMTALYDALALYIGQANTRDGQHVLVVYSDGGDSSSSMTFGRLDELLKLSSNVLVYAIGYTANETGTSRVSAEMQMNLMAHDTGGEAYFPGSPHEIGAIYQKLLEELQARYTIGYISSNRQPDGRYRKIDVKVVRPDLKGLKIRTRPGYYAPRAAKAPIPR